MASVLDSLVLYNDDNKTVVIKRPPNDVCSSLHSISFLLLVLFLLQVLFLFFFFSSSSSSFISLLLLLLLLLQVFFTNKNLRSSRFHFESKPSNITRPRRRVAAPSCKPQHGFPLLLWFYFCFERICLLSFSLFCFKSFPHRSPPLFFFSPNQFPCSYLPSFHQSQSRSLMICSGSSFSKINQMSYCLENDLLSVVPFCSVSPRLLRIRTHAE